MSRPRNFVVNDGPLLGPTSPVAIKKFKVTGKSAATSAITVCVIAVREYGDQSHIRVHRFAFAIPGVNTRESYNTWVAVPYQNVPNKEHTLFALQPVL